MVHIYWINPLQRKVYPSTCSCSQHTRHTQPSSAWFIILTHWGRDKMAAISQTTLSIAFSWMKMLCQWWLVYWRIYVSLGLNGLSVINCRNIGSLSKTNLSDFAKSHSSISSISLSNCFKILYRHGSITIMLCAKFCNYMYWTTDKDVLGKQNFVLKMSSGQIFLFPMVSWTCFNIKTVFSGSGSL